MDISKAACPECHEPLKIERMTCPHCKVAIEGDFELSPLAKLSSEDQIFVIAFVRHHGSIKKMESLFDVSYPTVKNRLNAISAALDKNFEAPSPNLYVLEQLSRGELTVAEALERLSDNKRGEN
ncbi:MAG TPA: DUF2089 domain-containing protein [Patescibacteria group bacterium]|nr:DUF2089 domain-containing protein [Patescibacteria group bacterium]